MNPILSMFASFVLIPLGVIGYFGVEDKNADFFANGDPVTAEYKIIYQKQAYHIGEMVSHWSNIVILSIVGGLISVIAHVGVMKC